MQESEFTGSAKKVQEKAEGEQKNETRKARLEIRHSLKFQRFCAVAKEAARMWG
jgi:hypothetical protein